METKQRKEIKVKKLSVFLIILEAVFVAISINCAMATSHKYNEVEEIATNYIEAQDDIHTITLASDYLTEKARMFVVTGDVNYANDYYNEINIQKRREKAVNNVSKKRIETGLGELDHMSMALEESNKLAEVELRAMALANSVYNIEESRFESKEIIEYSLRDEDKALAPEARLELAKNLVLGENYYFDKERIDSEVEKASETLLNDIETHKTALTKEYNIASILLKVMLAISALLFLVIVIALYRYLLNPVMKCVKNMETGRRMEYGPGHEVNYLSETYNKLYDKNITATQVLKNIAECDALTGLLNRGVYEKVKDFYKNRDEKIAVLLIDVDHFKNVNDTYGHEEGDRSLKIVAKLLQDHFREKDFVIRYGGDEFVVVMSGMDRDKSYIIERKLDDINESLKEYSESFGHSLSISVGVVFSKEGFTDELFDRADKALYETKEKGRCGYTIL